MAGARDLLFLVLIGVPACQGISKSPSASMETGVVTGSWGGARVGLELEASGGRLEYDCASGAIEQPLRLDGAGRFSATGYHIPGTGGPERAGHVPPRAAAVYAGRIEGDAMTLLVRIPSLGVEIGPLSLRRNEPPMLVRCL